MTTIAEMYNNVKSLNLRQKVPVLIGETKEEIIALNQQQLFTHSENSEGVPLRFYANNNYAFLKHAKNPLPGFGHPDLFGKGAFYRAFAVTVNPQFFEITSKDSKTKRLTELYGEEIFGLTTDNKAEYVQNTLFQGIKAYIEGKTGLQMV